MEGEDRRYWRVLMGYVSAQLQSRLVALNTAVQTHDDLLVQAAAANYQALAELTTQLHTVLADRAISPSRNTHGMKLIQGWLTDRAQTHIMRTRRLPRVIGNEAEQLRLLQEIIGTLDDRRDIIISYRQRSGELIMRIASPGMIPRLWIASRHNRLQAAARHTSEESLRGLLLGERLLRAQLRLCDRNNVYYLHFQLSRQLTLPL